MVYKEGEVIKIERGDRHYWWEGSPEARGAYATVCSVGWQGTLTCSVKEEYDSSGPEGLFLLYYSVVFAINGYLAVHPFLWESPESEEATQPKKGGPQ